MSRSPGSPRAQPTSAVGAARVHYFVHGHGRGHASRTTAIVRALRRAGHTVRIHAGDDARAVFEDEPDLVEVESLRPGAIASTPPLFARRLARARAVFEADPPHVVLSDGDLPGVVAAWRSRVPAIAVGHGLVFSHCEPPPGVPRLEWIREGLKAHIAAWSTVGQVAVSFVPLTARRPETKVAAPPPRSGLSRSARPGEHVLCYFSEGDGTLAVDALRALGLPLRVFAGSRARIDGFPSESPDAEAFALALADARAVVATAGSQLIAECLALGIPMLALALPGHREQRLNVRMLEAAGVGMGAQLERVTPREVRSFVGALERLGPRLVRRAPMVTADDEVVAAVSSVLARPRS